MKVVSFIKELRVIEKTLRHLNMWIEPPPRPPPPPAKAIAPPKEMGKVPTLDYEFTLRHAQCNASTQLSASFEQTCL